MQGTERLEQLARQMKGEGLGSTKPEPKQVTVRDFLGWFGNERRGKHVVSQIRNRMEDLELRTVPDFEFAFIDATISIELLLDPAGGASSSEGLGDPTVRIGALEAANQRPTTVGPNKALSVATTLMHLNDYSQLPVMVNKRTVKGVISWKSIGSRLALGGECRLVSDCMDPAKEIAIEAPLFDAIGDISEHGYVLVRGEKREITGIVTASDVARQFMQLAAPFLVIGEIEGHLRRLVHRKFTLEELEEASLNHEGGRTIAGSADLTFGDYCRLLQQPKRWCQLRLRVDRVGFTQHLDSVRRIRNDVMHFDPEGLAPVDTKKLQDLASTGSMCI